MACSPVQPVRSKQRGTQHHSLLAIHIKVARRMLPRIKSIMSSITSHTAKANCKHDAHTRPSQQVHRVSCRRWLLAGVTPPTTQCKPSTCPLNGMTAQPAHSEMLRMRVKSTLAPLFPFAADHGTDSRTKTSKEPVSRPAQESLQPE